MELPKQLKDEIWEYCRLNDISGVDDFIIKMVRQGFTSEKFGATPWDKPAEIKEVEVEKIVEKEVIKEVPVEVIREVEKIVEKEVFVTDDEVVNKLQIELKDVRSKLASEKLKSAAAMQETSQLRNKQLDEIDTLNGKISDLTKEISQLKEELEAEKAKPKEEDNDIYGEGKQGFFGSNISDLWNRKKK